MIDYHYQTFLVLADCLDYAKTAQELCLSKPAVTQHIQYLETDLEVKLFQNQGGNLVLTKKGQLTERSFELSSMITLMIYYATSNQITNPE
jgi:DNA-binding transcriptional LysR family regulator